MSETKLLTTIAEALLVFARGVDSTAIPRVTYNLEHIPSDIGTADWKLKVQVRGLASIDDEGNENIAFTHSWTGEGADSTTAALATLKNIVEGLQEEAKKKRREADDVLASAQESIQLLSAVQVGGEVTTLRDLWRTADPADMPPTQQK